MQDKEIEKFINLGEAVKAWQAYKEKVAQGFFVPKFKEVDKALKAYGKVYGENKLEWSRGDEPDKLSLFKQVKNLFSGKKSKPAAPPEEKRSADEEDAPVREDASKHASGEEKEASPSEPSDSSNSRPQGGGNDDVD